MTIEEKRILQRSLKKALNEIKHKEIGKALYRLGVLEENLTKHLKEIDNNENKL